MKTTLIILGAVLVTASTVGTIAFLGMNRSQQTLAHENERLKTELRAAEAKAEALLAEHQQGTEKLAAAQDLSTSLLSKMAEAEAANPQNAPAPQVKPYQAPAYLGQALLGPVWIVPRNMRMDTNAQRYVYEPVVVLDERYRGMFVTHYTNIVEREIATTYVENNTYPVYTEQYYYGRPGWPHGTNHNPNPIPIPTPVPTPPSPPPNVNSGAGKVTPPKLWIPADKIKTLPIGR